MHYITFFIASHRAPPFRTVPTPCFGARCSRGAMVVGRAFLSPDCTAFSLGLLRFSLFEAILEMSFVLLG